MSCKVRWGREQARDTLLFDGFDANRLLLGKEDEQLV